MTGADKNDASGNVAMCASKPVMSSVGKGAVWLVEVHSRCNHFRILRLTLQRWPVLASIPRPNLSIPGFPIIRSCP